MNTAVVLEHQHCLLCVLSAATAKRTRSAVACDCGAEYLPPPFDHEHALQQLLHDADTLARWGPCYQGSAMDIDRTRRAPSELLTDDDRERRDEQRERERSRARGLFVRLEALRCEAARTHGPELVRAVAVIDHLIERCGSERTRGHRVGGEVVAPKLSRLVGEAFADEATKQRARAVPPIAKRPPSDPPPKAPPELQLSPEPRPDMTEREIIDALSLRAFERRAHAALIDAYVVAGLAWCLRRLAYLYNERTRQQTAAEIRADAEQAKVAIERHGAELLRDAAWLWSATDVATEEPPRGFEEICGAAITRIVAEQERRKRAEGER